MIESIVGCKKDKQINYETLPITPVTALLPMDTVERNVPLPYRGTESVAEHRSTFDSSSSKQPLAESQTAIQILLHFGLLRF
jgi:hypothetical protein